MTKRYLVITKCYVVKLKYPFYEKVFAYNGIRFRHSKILSRNYFVILKSHFIILKIAFPYLYMVFHCLYFPTNWKWIKYCLAHCRGSVCFFCFVKVICFRGLNGKQAVLTPDQNRRRHRERYVIGTSFKGNNPEEAAHKQECSREHMRHLLKQTGKIKCLLCKVHALLLVQGQITPCD